MLYILIVDKRPIVRFGLELFLNSKPDFKVVGKLDNGSEIFDFIKNNQVDVVISGIDLPKLNGITALRYVKKEKPSINVLIYSDQPEGIYALSSIKAGASGYLNKTTDLSNIENAVRKISSGEIYLSEKMNQQRLSQDTKISRKRIFKKLSTREIEVLKLISIGKKNKEIAQELDINEKTVSTYKSRLYKKLNVNNIVDLIHQSNHHNLAVTSDSIIN